MVARLETAEQSSLTAPITWLVDLSTGQIAVIVATIAVAVVGLLMLDGRLDWRHGASVLLGCFLLFGASAISSAFVDFSKNAENSPNLPPESAVAPEAQMLDDDPWAVAALKQEPPHPTSAPSKP
jgi:type IV secretory pathway VirB2 component (pilin)